MDIVCLDLEGVLVPEIWIAFAEASGIPELKRTTRDEPDYDKLMKWRLGILKEHGLGLKEIQATIEKIDPLPGAKEFLDELRSLTQVIIISDTFTQFAKPLMKKLGWPTLFCNSLEVSEDGTITGFKMRIENSKLTTVKALQSAGFDTIAAGDSFNDLGMIKTHDIHHFSFPPLQAQPATRIMLIISRFFAFLANASSDITGVMNPISPLIFASIISTSPNTFASLASDFIRTKKRWVISPTGASSSFCGFQNVVMIFPRCLAASTISPATALAVGSLPAPLP